MERMIESLWLRQSWTLDEPGHPSSAWSGADGADKAAHPALPKRGAAKGTSAVDWTGPPSSRDIWTQL